MKYLLAHDLGTSGNKASLYSEDGKLVASKTQGYPLYTPMPGWAEQEPEDWWKAVCDTTKELLGNINPSDIAAVSFSGHMMGCLCVDKQGNPLDRAIIWADMRSTEQADKLRSIIDPWEFYRLTGVRLSSSQSITKIMWMSDNKPEIYKQTYAVLNSKDYIINKLTGKFVTDYSDASLGCLLNLDTLDWADELLKAAGIDTKKLPELHASTDVAGYVSDEASRLTGLKEGTPVVIGGGDGACAAVGTGSIKEGIANNCLGTSSWISVCSKEPVYDESMTTFNYAHVVPGCYVPCGTMQCGGGSLDWAVKQLCAKEYKEDKNSVYKLVSEMVSASPMGANGLFFLPYLLGERSPWWNADARASFVGLTLSHNRGDMLRAVMEGVAYNLDIILKAFSGKIDIKDLIVVGGGARNDVWLQILADVFGIPVKKPIILEEATSMGAAITAGVGVGLYESFDIAEKFISICGTFEPNMGNNEFYNKMKPVFADCYKRTEPIFEKIGG